MSVILGILGPISNSLFIKDWWTPLTIDGTGVGLIDSILVGFAIGGIVGVIYEDIFRKKHRRDKRLISNKERVLFYLMVPVSLGIFFGGFYFFELNSFITSTLALLVPALVILIRRPDLIKEAFVTGILLVIVAFVVYNFVELLTPGWIQAFFHFQNTPAIIIFNLPIDDMFHYFFLGLFAGPLYEYWWGFKLVKKESK